MAEKPTSNVLDSVPGVSALRRSINGALESVWAGAAGPEQAPGTDEAIKASAALAAPVVWLIGKVQSGKTSIVSALTGSTAAEVGTGYKACTATAAMFDFPAEAPVIRFLDTRGIGEAGYEPSDDIAIAEGQAHLLLVVMKAMDPAQSQIVEVMRAVRERHPNWPVLVAHTSLHEAYPAGMDHPASYPFNANAKPNADLPGDLARAITFQQSLFDNLPGRGPIAFAAIDFTKSGDGFTPEQYGLEALLDGLDHVAPAAITAVLGGEAHKVSDTLAARARPHILGHATAAAAIDVVPVAGVVGVPGVQARMLHTLAGIYGVTWDKRVMGEFAGALGTGVIVRTLSVFGVRELAKLVPVYGQTVGAAAAAASSFATTYALGMAASYYLGRKRVGAVDTSGVATTYKEALKAALGLAAAKGVGKAQTATPAASGTGGATP